MAYSTEDLEKLSLDVIEQHNLVEIKQVASFLPCSRATFYNHNLDKLDTIKEKLDNNKINSKQKLFQKWLDSDNPTLSIAAYKLMSDELELHKLTSSKFDHTTKGERMNLPQIEFFDTTEDEIEPEI